MKTNNIDEILKVVGPFNTYQWCLMVLMCYCMMTMGLQSLTMTFVARDPGWECVENSTLCNKTGIITSDSSTYDHRCDMERSDWRFPRDSSSIVVDVSLNLFTIL